MGKIFRTIRRFANPIKYWKSQGAIIGEDCEIYPTATIDSEPYLVRIGNKVRINSGVHLITHDGACWVLRHIDDSLLESDLFGRIEIGNNVSIGTNAMIMPRVKIGDNSIVGAGAIVTKDVPPNSVVAGVPAKVIESLDDYLSKNKDRLFMTKKFSRKDKRLYLEKNYK